MAKGRAHVQLEQVNSNWRAHRAACVRPVAVTVARPGFRPAFALESAEDDRLIAASPTDGARRSLDERRMSMFKIGGFFYSGQACASRTSTTILREPSTLIAHFDLVR